MQSHLFSVDTALLTNRVLIRRFREGDGAAFFELLQNNTAQIQDHFASLAEEVTHPQEAEAFIRRRLAAWLLQEEYLFGIWRSDEADLIGFIGFTDLDWQAERAEISYFLDQRHTGKGYMTEAMARVITFGFKQLQLFKLALKTLADNAASQRLARKVGFRREGDLRAEFRKASGAREDIILFGLTRQEYGLS
jgi:RimJ/RimL family protein N-acetyltransferase